MWRLAQIKSVWPLKAKTQSPSGSRREQFAMLIALVTVVWLGSALFLSKGTQFLMPGPLTSGHGAIENCSACHTKSGSNKMSWIHGLVAGDPLADSKACLTCLQRAQRFDQSAESKYQAADENRCGVYCAAIGWFAEYRVPDDGCNGKRSLLRIVPSGTPGRKFQSKQDFQRTMPFMPRCEV
jgi:hypothetical protein